MNGEPPKKVLFGHTPKAAGLHLIEYFAHELNYPMIQSDHQFDNGVWRDFSIDQLLEKIGADEAFLSSHVLAFGWSELVELIPFAEEESIVDAIRSFRSKGWFTFTFVRHPGELLTSFYFYILDAHERGWHDSVALHTPAVGRSLEEFVAEHCEKERRVLPQATRPKPGCRRSSRTSMTPSTRSAGSAAVFPHLYPT